MTCDREQRLVEIAKIAVKLENETGVPSRLLIATWATESSWGSKPVGQWNMFGMKRASRHAKFVLVPTHEIINGVSELRTKEFADYDSLEESAADYATLITTGAPYREAWSAYKAGGKFETFVRAVMSRYATSKYGDLALQIAGQPNIGRVIDEAREA